MSASSKHVTSKPPPSRTAWKQRVSDTASEADNDDFLGKQSFKLSLIRHLLQTVEDMKSLLEIMSLDTSH